MKRKSCLTLALILIMAQVISLFAVLPATAATSTSKNYNLIKAEEGIVIDGKADDSAWANADWSSPFVKTSSDDVSNSGLTARFKAVWTPVEDDDSQMIIQILIVSTGHVKWTGRQNNWRNNIRVRIETSDGTQAFWTGQRSLTDYEGGIFYDESRSFTGSSSGGANASFELNAVDDIVNSGTATYELRYQMKKDTSIKLDVIACAVTESGGNIMTSYSWAGMTNDATAVTGTGTILNQTTPVHNIDIIKTTEEIKIDGTADDLAWANAEWSSSFVNVTSPKLDAEGAPQMNDSGHAMNGEQNVDGFAGRFKAVWSPVEGDDTKMNIYILVEATNHVNYRHDNQRNNIRIQIENEDGSKRFWTGQKTVADYSTPKTATGSSIGGWSAECTIGSVNGISTAKKSTYEFCYQTEKMNSIKLDVTVSACSVNWGIAQASWAGMRGAESGIQSVSGIGMILDTTDSPYSIDIIKTTKDIQVDGVAEDVWNFSNSSENFQKVGQYTLDGFTGSFKAMWSPVEGDDNMMNLYILVVAKGHLTWENRLSNTKNSVFIQIESADGTKRFWSGMETVTNFVADKNTTESVGSYAEKENGVFVTKDSAKTFKIATTDSMADAGMAIYEICYQMEKADSIRLDVGVGAVNVDWYQAESSWAGVTITDCGYHYTRGVANLVETTLDDVKLIEDQETQGASVYLNTETSDLSGIRFATTINVDAFNGLMAQGATITTGTFVTYTENLTTLGIADENFNLDTLLANGWKKTLTSTTS